MAQHEIKNKYGDSYDTRYQSANNLLKVLRQRCVEADIHLSNSITFHSNFTRHELYVRGYSIIEIFIAVFNQYLRHSAHTDLFFRMDFNIPRFGVECINFTIPQSSLPVDYERLLEPASTLVDMLKNKYLEFLLSTTTMTFVSRHEIAGYIPIILLCKRKGVCQEIEDIIHTFLGNRPINRWNKITNYNQTIANTIKPDDKHVMESLYRSWRSVNGLLWEEY